MILVFGRNSFTPQNPSGCSHVWAAEAIIWDGRNFWFDANDTGGAAGTSTTGGPQRIMHVGLCWGGSGSADTMDIEDLGHGVEKITIV